MVELATMRRGPLDRCADEPAANAAVRLSVVIGSRLPTRAGLPGVAAGYQKAVLGA